MFGDKINNIIKDKTILFVDDERQIADMFCNLFRLGLGLKSYCAYDGQEGLELFKKYNYDIIVTDIQMPKLNGHEMMQEILKINKDIKVIFVSGHKEEFYNEAFKEFKDNIEYIDKPISTEKLQNALERIYK